MPRSLHIYDMTEDSHCQPWSLWSWVGGETLENISLTSFTVTAVAPWFWIAKASVHSPRRLECSDYAMVGS